MEIYVSLKVVKRKTLRSIRFIKVFMTSLTDGETNFKMLICGWKSSSVKINLKMNSIYMIHE